MPKPTLAALPGPAAGAGGRRWRWPAHLRIMASTAIMTTAFARVGFSGDYGGTYFMTQLVGAAKARELYFLSGARQRRRGSCASDLLIGYALQRIWLRAPTKSALTPSLGSHSGFYRYTKENLNRAMNRDVDDCLDLEATHHILCGQTEDHREREPRLC